MLRSRGFTLIELLLVIGILSILATVAVLVVNPAEYLRQSRDVRRAADLDTISKGVNLFVVQRPSVTELGLSTTVYISAPDTSSTCANLGLQALPSPWQYHCVTSADLRKVDGTGWLPIDFASIPTGAPFSALPVDPVNTVADARYYTFTASGLKYELFSVMESEKYILGGPNDKLSSDGGDDFTRYETGSDLVIAPWSFEFLAFATSTNNSKKPGWYKYTGTGSVSIESDAQTANFLRVTGQVWYGWQENIPYNPASLYEAEYRVRQVTDPTTGGKEIYCGFNGVAADGTTLVNVSGNATYSGQHYRAFSGAGTVLTAGAGWAVNFGYTRGYGTPNGQNGTCSNFASPCAMHANVRYIRPMFLFNYSAGDGIVDIDYIKITKR